MYAVREVSKRLINAALMHRREMLHVSLFHNIRGVSSLWHRKYEMSDVVFTFGAKISEKIAYALNQYNGT